MRDDKIAKGKVAIFDAFRDRGIEEKEALELLNSQKVFDNYGVDSLDNLFIAISNRNPAAGNVIEFLNIKKKTNLVFAKARNDKDSDNPILVKNAGKVAINLGSCCTPIPGDDIVGYITKGKGITIHRRECPNIKDGKRLVEVFWNENLKEQTYPVDIEMEFTDRNNLLMDIMTAFSIHKVSVTNISAKSHKTTLTATITVTILLKNNNEYENIKNVLLNVNGVYEVNRTIH